MDIPRQPTPAVWEGSEPSSQMRSSQSDQDLRSLKRRRSNTSLMDCCRTCRLRKVKCSGNPGDGGPCSNCMRLELACGFNDGNRSADVASTGRVVSRTTPSRSHTEAGTLRKRAQRACTECHSHKTRCSGDYPRCKRCEASNLACEYAPAKRRFQHIPASAETLSDSCGGSVYSYGTARSSTVGDAQSADNGDTNNAGTPAIALPDLTSLVKENILANKDLVLRHIDAYFEHLYFTPCLGYLHKETVYKELEEGRLHAARAAGICSVSAFFVSPGSKAVDFASRCSMQVEFHIFRTIGSLKEINLFLYSFDILHNHMSGKYAKCWQLMAVATRLMYGLQLNWDVPGSNRPFKEHECARRLAWQIFHLDRVFAGGFDAYICCREDNMRIQLPCPEDAFSADKEVFVERLQDKPSKARSPPGLHGYQIRLVNIRHHIRTMATKFASGPAYLQRARWEPSKVMEDIRKLQLELSRFSSSLPANLKLSDQNISRWVHSPEKQVFVLLHGLYCTTHIDLYRFSLPGIREKGTPDLLKKLPGNFILKSQKQAIAHAVTLARFWETVYNETRRASSGKAILIGDYNIAESIEQCVRVLITATQHKLYRDLNSHSTAPLWRNEAVSEGSLRPLIDSCLRVLEPWSRVIPSVKPRYDELVKTVDEFRKTSIYEEADVELTAGGDGLPIRLPGAHYLLEHAYKAQNQEQEQPPMPAALMERFYSATMETEYTHDYYAGLDAPDEDWQAEGCPPGMPILLAEARGLPLEQLCLNDPPPPTSTGPPVGPGVSAPAPVQGGYSHGPQMMPVGQGGGLPGMTLGHIPAFNFMGSQPPAAHQQLSFSGQQDEHPVQNFGAPLYDGVPMGSDVLSQQSHGYSQG